MPVQTQSGQSSVSRLALDNIIEEECFVNPTQKIETEGNMVFEISVPILQMPLIPILNPTSSEIYTPPMLNKGKGIAISQEANPTALRNQYSKWGNSWQFAQESITIFLDAKMVQQPMKVRVPQELFPSLNPIDCRSNTREEAKAKRGKDVDQLPFRKDSIQKQLDFKSPAPITPSALKEGAAGRAEPADPMAEMIQATVEHSNTSVFNAPPIIGDEPVIKGINFPPTNPL